MDTRKLIEVLRATIDPNQQQQAEEQLNQVHKIIGFAPSLLQVVMMNDLDMPVRQAGVIYLKNLVIQWWQDREVEPGQQVPFNIHEQDRAMIRDAIVDAVVHAPELVRVQLAVCVIFIVKHDFPGRWTGIVDKVSVYLQNTDSGCWIGALLCLYQLVKNYEYKKPEECLPLNEAMNLLLPMVYQRCLQLLPDDSEASVLIQKQILKIFFALVQYSLPLELITRETFSQWMELLRAIVVRPIPEKTLHMDLDDDERQELAWWKCKKWALHILARVFERYGSPGSVTKEYKQFAEYYLKTYSAGILEVLLKVLDEYRQHKYVSPRVLQQTLNYINQAIKHALSWKLVKPHMLAIIQDVIFPLMCYTDQDEALWDNDPHEFIRLKFDIFEDFVSPVTAAQTMLHSASKKRKDILQQAMNFVMTIVTNATVNPRLKDGALHMVGSVADILLKKKVYKDQMEQMLVLYVFPEFQNPHGYMRARACWVLHSFSEVKFVNEENLVQALDCTQRCLLQDKELPVKVEAAIALQLMLASQDKAQKLIEPIVKPIALELLQVIRETENDDLTTVMQKLVCSYTEQLMPIAVEMTQHLAATFSQVLESEDGSEEKTITAMGILNTIETILSVMEDNKEIMTELEKIVLNVIGLVLTKGVIEFFEEILALVYSLTCNSISPDLWKVFEMIYDTFQADGFDYFTDMMPSLHNYITVDTQAFLSNEKYPLAIFNICKLVLTGDSGEDPECNAAKLLEVVILQCKGQINQCIPSFVQLVFERLSREVKTSELRTMCLQVVIAALYYDPQLLLGILEQLALPNVNGSLTTLFINQWIHDTDCFLGLHDRKLCVLGLCTLIGLPQTINRPQALLDCASKILPALLVLFNGLKKAYANRAQLEDDEDESDEDEEDFDPEVLESDEDDIDEDEQAYLDKLQTKDGEDDDDEYEDDDDDDDDEDDAETALETFSTPLDAEDCLIDEYNIFKEVLQGIQTTDPVWYGFLTAYLTPEHMKSLNDVFVLADQRKAAAESKRIEQSGGYVFQNQTVPKTFNFGEAFS